MTSSGPEDSGTTAAEDGTTSIIGRCGNNVLDGDEFCDTDQLNGETCESLGFGGGELGCLLTCAGYNTQGCTNCGNGTIEMLEDCDGDVPREVNCVSLGFDAGEIVCGGDCLYDLSDCSLCGDGIQQAPEECEFMDLNGQTCVTLGFRGGDLQCDIAQCVFDTSGCQ